MHIKNGLLAKMLSYCTEYMQSQKEVYDKAYRYSFKETPKSPRDDAPNPEVDDEMVDMTENDSELTPLNINS